MSQLKIAALSGVKIKLMIAGVPDKKIPYWIAETYFEELLMAGVEIYRYKAGFIHCKNIVVDGRVSTMGTCNFDMRSFEINYEVNSIFYNQEISQNIRNQFYKDLGGANYGAPTGGSPEDPWRSAPAGGATSFGDEPPF